MPDRWGHRTVADVEDYHPTEPSTTREFWRELERLQYAATYSDGNTTALRRGAAVDAFVAEYGHLSNNCTWAYS